MQIDYEKTWNAEDSCCEADTLLDGDDDGWDSPKRRNLKGVLTPSAVAEAAANTPDDLLQYSEMIVLVLKDLGRGATAEEIMALIEQKYASALQTKTKTWRNSIMGCLSANRRNLFTREPVKENAKRYVWKLNEDITPNYNYRGRHRDGRKTSRSSKRRRLSPSNYSVSCDASYLSSSDSDSSMSSPPQTPSPKYVRRAPSPLHFLLDVSPFVQPVSSPSSDDDLHGLEHLLASADEEMDDNESRLDEMPLPRERQRRFWTPEEDAKLRELVLQIRPSTTADWEVVAAKLGRTVKGVKHKYVANDLAKLLKDLEIIGLLQ